MVQTAVDVKQLELTQLTEQLAGVQHQLTITQQVTWHPPLTSLLTLQMLTSWFPGWVVVQ